MDCPDMLSFKGLLFEAAILSVSLFRRLATVIFLLVLGSDVVRCRF